MTAADSYERLAYHLDSIVALVLFLYASIVALTINHARSPIRVFGFVLAALGCFSVVAAIGLLHTAGAFDEMRPPRFSVDPYKPGMMWLLALAFFIAGLALVVVANSQRHSNKLLKLDRKNSPAGYGRISRYLHWTIAILFLLLIPMGVFATMLPYDVEYRHAIYVIHKTAGLTVLVLAAVRVAWLLYSSAPLAETLSRREKALARVAHVALYIFLLAFPVSGFVLGTSLGKVSHFYIWDLPMLWEPHEASLAWARWAHKIVLPFTFYLVFLSHLLGAFKHRFVGGHENGAKRMVT